MKLYKKNLNKLIQGKVYNPNQEHDACGVGFVASTDGIKSRRVVEFGIDALKAVWHRGAVDADGKTGDGAGIHIEIPQNFFIERIQNAGRLHKEGTICIGMIFLPRNDYPSQEKCKTIVENELLNKNYYVYRWRQVPVNTKVLGIKAESNRPEIVQVIFKSNNSNLLVSRLGTIKINMKSMETNINGIFAAGDIVRGASLVVWAIKDGREAAISIQKYLELKQQNKIKAA